MGKSYSSVKKTSVINTSTDTTIRDIGFTGAQAVDLAAANGAVVLGMQNQGAKLMGDIIQQSGDNFNRLVGGAGDLLVTAENASKKIIETTRETTGEGISFAGRVISEGADLSRKGFDFTEETTRRGFSFGEGVIGEVLGSADRAAERSLGISERIFEGVQDASSNILSQSTQAGKNIIEQGKSTLTDVIQATSQATRGDLASVMPMIIAGIVGIAFFLRK